MAQEKQSAPRKRKPIRVFWSTLGNRFYASQHYKIEGERVTITGAKFDVTDDIAAMVIEHEIEFTKDKTCYRCGESPCDCEPMDAPQMKNC